MISFLVQPPADLSTLPEPPVPADLDLRHFDCMHLNTADLLNSPIWEECSDAGVATALRLWAKAWQQVPCSSIPNDVRKVRSWGGCDGRTKRWNSVQKDALRGFILCSDGRLYHHKVAEAASNAMSKSRAGKRGAKAKWEKVNALKNHNTGDAVASSRSNVTQDGKGDDIIYGSGDGKRLAEPMQRREGNTLPPTPLSTRTGSRSLDAPRDRSPLPPADDRVEVDVGGGVIFAIAANGLCEHVQSPRDAEIPTLTPARAIELRAAALNPLVEHQPKLLKAKGEQAPTPETVTTLVGDGRPQPDSGAHAAQPTETPQEQGAPAPPAKPDDFDAEREMPDFVRRRKTVGAA